MRLFIALILLSVSARALPLQPMEVINPIAPIEDKNLGTLIVTVPDLSARDNEEIADLDIQTGNTRLEAGRPVRMESGEYVIQVTTEGVASHKSVAIAEARTTQVDLAAVSVNWDMDVLKVDLGPKPALVARGRTTGFRLRTKPGGDWLARTPGKTRFRAMLADDYSFWFDDFPILDKLTETVTAGQISRITLPVVPDKRATINLIAPPSRLFPDAMANAAKCGGEAFVVQGTSSLDDLRFNVPLSVWTGADYDYSGRNWAESYDQTSLQGKHPFRFFPRESTYRNLLYKVVVGNTVLPLQLKPGESTDLQLHRIDVNDVLVTRKDGSQELIPGTYAVETPSIKDGSKWKAVEFYDWQRGCTESPVLLPNPRTKTGFNVVPGIYRVTVSFRTKEGPQTYVQVVDLR